jgi:hypothetical protein
LAKRFETEISKRLEMIRIVPLSPCECRATRPGKSEKAKKKKEQTKSMKNRNVIFAVILSAAACFPLVIKAQAAPEAALPGLNTADGDRALFNITTGTANTAVGWRSLTSDTTGSFNTGLGAGTLALNTTEDSNTAVGTAALLLNTGGISNTAVGRTAMLNNSTGNENTAVGVGALSGCTSGGFNTAIGGIAGAAVTTGQFNTIIGDIAGLFVTTASNTICIGGSGINVSGTCQIGHIRGVQTVNNDAVNVVVDSAGQLGTVSSSGRFKKDVKPMDQASEAVLALKPVTFHYKSDKTNRPEFGLIAEEVAKVNPNLVVHQDGQIYTVRYEAVNAMLLNEFLKEHQTVQELKTTVAQQKKQIDALIAGLEKVSAQLEVRKPATQVAISNK